jgi:hypothetical protein
LSRALVALLLGFLASNSSKKMTVLPVPVIPSLQARYLGATPPAGLQVLAAVKRILPPAGTDGVALPVDKINPYSGLYDKDGRLPQIPGPGTTFVARV